VDAPTLIAVEMHAGAERALVAPLLPAAMIVAMPALRKFSMAALRESESHVVVKVLPPRLMFTEAML
jgi:hypothetical protein